MVRVYKLYGSSTSTTNALAQLTIQKAGKIVAIAMHLGHLAAAGGERVTDELSFTSTQQTATNDTIGPIAQVASGSVSAGAYAASAVVSAPGIGVGVGDRLYINRVIHTGTPTTVTGTHFVYVEEGR